MQFMQGLALVSVSWGPEQSLLRQPQHMKIPWKTSFCPPMFIVYHSRWPSWTRLLCPGAHSGLRDKKPTGTRQPQAGRMGWELKGGRVLRKDTSWRGAQTLQGTEIAIAHTKVPGGQRLCGVTKLEGSVGQNNEVKRGVSSHVPWGHPDGSGDPSREERSG